ncbi:hypothetical protein ACP4OV_007555 [Aristida adscensionis]
MAPKRGKGLQKILPREGKKDEMEILRTPKSQEAKVHNTSEFIQQAWSCNQEQLALEAAEGTSQQLSPGPVTRTN